MKRRSILQVCGGSADGVALVAAAQTRRPVARLGVLGNLAPTMDARAAAAQAALIDGLKAWGWEEGRNLVIEWRYANNHHRLYRKHAAELIAAKVDAIFAPGDEAVAAAYEATRTIPIVMMGFAAVEAGYAKSMARPGGNVTGVVYLALDFIGKEFDMMRALRPDLRRVGLCAGTPNPALNEIATRLWRTAAEGQNVTVALLPDIRSMEDIDPMLLAARNENIQTLLIGVRPFLLGAGWRRIREWAIDRRVATHSGTWARGEVLVAFGPAADELRSTAYRQIDGVLRGGNPAEMPIEQPTKFELIVSSKIAKALRLSIPKQLLLSATEVLE